MANPALKPMDAMFSQENPLDSFLAAAPMSTAAPKRFPITMSAEFHRDVVKCARRRGESLREFITAAIVDRMNQKVEE
jgi:predicted HicB family RNase H-like nuclease